MKQPGNRLMLGVLIVDAAVLAVFELFFLPLRVNDLGSPRSLSWVPHALYTWPIPISILLAVLTTPLLVLNAGRYSDNTFGVGTPLFCWLFCCLFLGVGGPGGDFVLLSDWRSVVFLLAGALSGAAALGKVLGRKEQQKRRTVKQTDSQGE